MLRKLIGVGLLGALGYGIYTFANNSDFFGTRDHDRNERMNEVESAANQGLGG